MANVICPFCYATNLKRYPETSESLPAKTITAENANDSNAQFICMVCNNIFTGREALILPDPASPPPVYYDEAIDHLNPDELFIFDMCRGKGKFEAVKYCVTTYGWGLKEAKEYVDEIMERVEHNHKKVPIAEANLEEEVMRIIQEQGKLPAIKFVRDKTRQGLKESKQYVDSLYAVSNIRPSKKEGCFIATACYGDYHAPEVLALRQYRDQVLDRSQAGRIFIRLYYKISPVLAGWLRNAPKSKAFLRKYLLAPLVRRAGRNKYQA